MPMCSHPDALAPQSLPSTQQVAKTAADCKMEMDVDEYVDSFRPGQCLFIVF